MPQLQNGQGREIAIPPGQSIAISTVTGTYTAEVLDGAAKGVIASGSDGGGTFGPYASGATVKVTAGSSALVTYDVGLTPSAQGSLVPSYATDASGNVTGLVGPDGGVFRPKSMDATARRTLGVRADSVATLTAQNTWLTGQGFDHLIMFAERGNASYPWSDSLEWTNARIAEFAATGYELKWAIPICTGEEGIEETIAGTHDTVIRQIAQAIATAAPSTQSFIDIRPGWEPNFSTSYPWGSTLVTTAQYIAGFKRVVNIFRAVDSRFRVTFCPSIRVDNAWPWEEMYAGDEYVDVIGVDAYMLTADKGSMTDTEHAEWMFSGVCGINRFRDFAIDHEKPLAICEWGTNYDNPLYVERMGDFARTNNVAYHAYWDQNNGAFTCKLSGDQWPNSAMAFVNNFGAINIDTWGIAAAPGQRLRTTVQANKPIQRIEITAGNNSGVAVVNGVEVVAEPQVGGTSRRVTVKAYDERGQYASRSLVLTWQAGRFWTPAELGANLTDWYSMDLHGRVSRHIGAIKSVTSLSSATRIASAPSAAQRPTFGYSSGGVPRASFDGGDALVQTDVTAMPAAQAAVTYAVQLYTDPAASNFTYFLIDSDANAGVRGFGFNGGNLRIASTGGYAGGSIVGSERSIVVSFGAGSSSSARGSIDGNAPALGTVSIPAATYTRRVIGANAGASNAVGSYYLGVMSELFVANVAFSAAQEDLTHGYLAWKYGRESSLPGGHAYKNNPPMV